MIGAIRRRIRSAALRWVARHILKFVTYQDVLKKVDGHLVIHGQKVDPSIEKRLREEAVFIKNSMLYPYLMDVLSYGLQERILNEASDTYDLWTGRSARLFAKQFFDAINTIAEE